MNESAEAPSFKDRVVQDAQGPVGPQVKLFFLRRSAGDFASTLQRRIAELNLTRIHSATQSESDGSISLVVFYT